MNLIVTRVLGGHAHAHGPGHDHGHDHDHSEHDRPRRSLNLEGSYQHILTDLFAFAATAVAATVILLTGFNRADAIASLLIAAVMLYASYGLIKASMRVMMEAAPEGIDPDQIGAVPGGAGWCRRGSRPPHLGGHLRLFRNLSAHRGRRGAGLP